MFILVTVTKAQRLLQDRCKVRYAGPMSKRPVKIVPPAVKMPDGQGTYGNFATRLWPDGSVSVEFYDHSHPSGQPLGNLKTGELRVWFERADGRPSKITLEAATGLTAGALHDFPWRRWLTVADAASKALRDDSPASWEHFDDVGWRAVKEERVPPKPAPRPGRAGHEDSFYADIARRYRELRLDGCPNPTLTIAKEMGYSRATVAGWVHKARLRGHLKKVRPGTAGG